LLALHCVVKLPLGTQQWGTAKQESVDFADFVKVSNDVFYNFSDPSMEKIIGDEITWTRDTDLDDFAASLISHQKALEKLQVWIESSSRLENAKGDEIEVVDGCTARHLGAGVIAMELAKNPVENKDVAKTGATVLSRSNARLIVKKTIDILKTGDSVFVIGQPGE
jgi:hypothetical protein